MTHTDDVQLIYIAGYGRSGSTLLDALLGNHPRIFGAGELSWLFSRNLDDSPCCCGAPLVECPFWRAVLAEVFDALPDLDCRAAAEITRQAESLPTRRRDLATYAALWKTTLRAIARLSGRPLIVDSSKSSRLAHHRMSLLRQQADVPLKVVHLVRDPRAVMWSTCRGSNRRLQRGDARPLWGGTLRTLLSWTCANVAVEWTQGRSDADDYMRLRYEDLVQSPQSSLGLLEHFLGIDAGQLTDVLSGGDSLQPGHGVGGNRMRHSGPIVLRFDDQWRTKLPHLPRHGEGRVSAAQQIRLRLNRLPTTGATTAPARGAFSQTP